MRASWVYLEVDSVLWHWAFFFKGYSELARISPVIQSNIPTVWLSSLNLNVWPDGELTPVHIDLYAIMLASDLWQLWENYRNQPYFIKGGTEARNI